MNRRSLLDLSIGLAGGREELRSPTWRVGGETENQAKLLKMSDARKRRNEIDAKPLKTNDSAKSVIRVK
jgi:hypothetical protein